MDVLLDFYERGGKSDPFFASFSITTGISNYEDWLTIRLQSSQIGFILLYYNMIQL